MPLPEQQDRLDGSSQGDFGCKGRGSYVRGGKCTATRQMVKRRRKWKCRDSELHRRFPHCRSTKGLLLAAHAHMARPPAALVQNLKLPGETRVVSVPVSNNKCHPLQDQSSWPGSGRLLNRCRRARLSSGCGRTAKQVMKPGRKEAVRYRRRPTTH